MTARYPLLIKKLILIGSGPFEEKYTNKIMETRLNRLSDDEKIEVPTLLAALDSNNLQSDDFARFGELMGKADAFDPLPYDSEVLPCSPNIYQQVWGEADKLRSSGKLLKLSASIRCPVVAIHGAYDPHPAAGVREPLSRVLKDFRFILLATAAITLGWSVRRNSNFTIR